MDAPTAERVYASTKNRILSGDLAGGALLSEVTVAGELQVSRTPVREAFVRLQAEGFLELHPKRGAVVVPVSPTELDDVLEVREALESSAARRLALLPSEVLQARLEPARHAIVDQKAAGDDLARFAEADARFHRALVSASGNAIAGRMYATLDDRQRRMVVGSLKIRPEHLPVLVKEHRALLKAVRAHDASAFADLLHVHLERAHRP